MGIMQLLYFFTVLLYIRNAFFKCVLFPIKQDKFENLRTKFSQILQSTVGNFFIQQDIFFLHHFWSPFTLLNVHFTFLDGIFKESACSQMNLFPFILNYTIYTLWYKLSWGIEQTVCRLTESHSILYFFNYFQLI